MKKIILLGISIATSYFFFFSVVTAQGMMTTDSNGFDDHTAREEAEGKVVWEKLQVKQIACADLTVDDFGVLGEYFMGQRTGAAHEAMNNMMIGMMGEEGEEQMHVAMGRRLSGCDTSAVFPMQGDNFMPVMNMMMGMGGGGNLMTNPGFMSFSGFNPILMILWWGLVIFGLVSLIKWIMAKAHSSPTDEIKPNN